MAEKAPAAQAPKSVSLEINDLLQVKVTDDPNSLTYPSRVADLVDDRIVISWPTDRGVRIPIHEKHPLELSFVRQDSAYSFMALVEERVHDGVPLLKVRPIGPPARVQRRQYYRVKAAIPVELTGTLPVTSSTMNRGSGEVLLLRTYTYDISGSGIGLRHPNSIPQGTILDIKLTLPGELTPIKVLAKVVHSQPIVVAPDKVVFHIGMLFIVISEPERTRIVRHVFRVQQTSLSA